MTTATWSLIFTVRDLTGNRISSIVLESPNTRGLAVAFYEFERYRHPSRRGLGDFDFLTTYATDSV